MIIGLIGPSREDLQVISDYICESNDFQVINEAELLKHFDEVHLKFAITNNLYKLFILKILEQELGAYVIYGNILLNEDICRWMANNDNEVVIVTRDHMDDYPYDTLSYPEDYWKNSGVQVFELETKYNQLYDSLSKAKKTAKNLVLLNLSDEDFDEDIAQILQRTQSCKGSKMLELDAPELIKLITRKEDTSMTMEESIKNAMRELGVSFDTEDSVSNTKPVTVSSNSKPERVTKNLVLDTPMQNFPEPKQKTHVVVPTVEEEPENALFIKMTDTNMAILIPSDLKMKTQSIGGIEFKVATVRLPDINCRKLQELSIIEDTLEKSYTSKTSIKREPICCNETPDSDNESVSSCVDISEAENTSNDLQSLMNEKASIDAEIKKYRGLGDIERVNELRKHRRALRAKINKLK